MSDVESEYTDEERETAQAVADILRFGKDNPTDRERVKYIYNVEAAKAATLDPSHPWDEWEDLTDDQQSRLIHIFKTESTDAPNTLDTHDEEDSRS